MRILQTQLCLDASVGKSELLVPSYGELLVPSYGIGSH